MGPAVTCAVKLNAAHAAIPARVADAMDRLLDVAATERPASASAATALRLSSGTPAMSAIASALSKMAELISSATESPNVLIAPTVAFTHVREVSSGGDVCSHGDGSVG